MIHYLPSCKFKASHPETSSLLQTYLSNNGVNVSGCCRLSQNQFGKGDTVLTNCTSCAIITDEQSPEVNEISVYEYLLNDSDFNWPNLNGEEISVQDCYRCVDKPEVQKAIRECLIKMNAVPVEIEENFEKTQFDGTYKYNNVSKSNLDLAPQYYTRLQNDYIKVKTIEEQIQEMKKWVEQYKTERVVCYCNSCLKGLKLGNANAIHILDVITRNLKEISYVKQNRN